MAYLMQGFVLFKHDDQLRMPPECDLSLLKTVRQQIEEQVNKQICTQEPKPADSQSPHSRTSQENKWPKWQFPALPANILVKSMKLMDEYSSMIKL